MDRNYQKYFQQLRDIGAEASKAGDHSPFLVALTAMIVEYDIYLLQDTGNKAGAIGLGLVCATLKQLKNLSTDDLPFDEFITVPTKE